MNSFRAKTTLLVLHIMVKKKYITDFKVSTCPA